MMGGNPERSRRGSRASTSNEVSRSEDLIKRRCRALAGSERFRAVDVGRGGGAAGWWRPDSSNLDLTLCPFGWASVDGRGSW